MQMNENNKVIVLSIAVSFLMIAQFDAGLLKYARRNLPVWDLEDFAT